MDNLKGRMREVNPLILLLVICFAWSSWIDIYGVWVELPILVHILPEGWKLPSFILIIIECANVVLISYTLVNKCCSGNMEHREVTMAYIIMGTGLMSLILLTFLWRYTVWFAGQERSLALLLLVLFLAMVDTTSCVVYLPFMSRLKTCYMPAFVAGEEMGGLITGVVGLIQGAGGHTSCYNHTTWVYNETLEFNQSSMVLAVSTKQPRFPVSVFFVFLTFMMATSITCFSLLNFSNFAQKAMVLSPEMKKGKAIALEQSQLEKTLQSEELIACQKKEDSTEPVMPPLKLSICLFMYAWTACLMYGLFSSIHSFSTLPYGPLPYTFALRLISVVNPVAAFAAFFVRVQTLSKFSLFVGTSTIVLGYHLFLAIHSPDPPLKDTTIGTVLVVVTSVIGPASFAYVRACIATLLRQEGGHRALYLGGAAIQAGAVIGGILGFILVNVVQVFKSIPPCA